MGFRSTFATNEYNIKWPAWFREKYAGLVRFRDDGIGALSSAFEAKTYAELSELPNDIQKAIVWGDWLPDFVIVYLHECGGITRCQIEEHAIKWTEPTEWRETEGVTHDYCYGCSDA